MTESIDLETKDLQCYKKEKVKQASRANTRRHTHYYFTIPSHITSSTGPDDLGLLAAPGTSSMSASKIGGGSTGVKKFFGKKVSDTMHSASKFKKYISESFSVFGK